MNFKKLAGERETQQEFDEGLKSALVNHVQKVFQVASHTYGI